MSYNLDALTDETGIEEESLARSPDRDESVKKTKSRKAARKNKSKSSTDALDSTITYKSLIRHGIFFALFIAAGVATFLFRDEVMSNVGYGALPVGLWAVLFVYMLITRTRWLVQRYRETASSLIVVVGGVAVLGIFDAPLGAASGATMGGRLGEILAREPWDWHRYDLVLWQQALAWVRAGALFTIGAALQFPTAFGVVLKVVWIALMMMISASVSLFMMVGGAVATKRKKSEIAAVESDDQRDPIATSVSSDFDDEYSAFQPLPENHRLALSNQADISSDAVIGMGGTIIVEDEEDDVPELIDEEQFIEDLHIQEEGEDWQTVGSTAEFDLSEEESEIVDELDGFIEVGAAVGDTEETSNIVVAESEIATIVDDEVQLDEPEQSTDTDQSLSSDAEDVLEMITSGAAVEAAMQTFPWHLPPVEFLATSPKGGVATTEIKATSDLIEETLAEHSIAVTVDQVRVGPTVTMYGLKPGWKGSGSRSNAPRQRVRVDTILNREKDIALALSSPNIRFESVVPGASVVGIEVPNARPTPVNLRTVMDSEEWLEFVDDAALPVPLGMGSGGNPVMADFSKMPHTLVAGATGSGKSVCMNTIVTGLLMTRTPVELRMVMIDPKRVELTPYQGIPHLYTPVIVEPERAVKALKALVKEMMDRFSTLEAAGVKNISTYNEKSTTKMPYLLILVDELADLMLTSSSEVEQLLVRLAQLGRATGVHLVVATQRPSVDVVTGLIKANFPSRISFAVGSQVDSRTILDATGADRLLGKGDMLYKPIDLSQPVRVQGAFLAEEEIETVVDFWKQVGAPPLPQLDIDNDDDDEGFAMPGMSEDNGDALFMQASAMAKSQKTLSTSLLQRRLRIGYPRAARLMDELEEAGIVGPGEPGKPRQVIANG